MQNYTENYCLAVLITSLKRRTRYPDALTVAQCAKFLYDLYGSFEAVSQKTGTHPSVIRKWILLAAAPEALRQAVGKGTIYPVAAFAILSAFKDNDKREEIAREVEGWGEPEIVRFIKLLKETPQLSVSECKNLFLNQVISKLR